MYFGDPEGLGAALATFRRAKGWTQKELAERANIKQSTVSAAENHPAQSSTSTIFKILQALEIQVQLIDKKVLIEKSTDFPW